MRRSAFIVALSALAIAFPAAAAGPPPSLRLVSMGPLTVHGAHFKARETVRLTLRSTDMKRARVLRSSLAGSFTVVYTSRIVDPCLETVRITAVGARGSDAVLKLPQRACPPAP